MGLLLTLFTAPLRANAAGEICTNDFGPYFLNAQSWNGQFTVYTNDFGSYSLDPRTWSDLFTAYTNDFGAFSLAALSGNGSVAIYTNDFGSYVLVAQNWSGLFTAYTNDFGAFALTAQNWNGLFNIYTNDFGSFILVAEPPAILAQPAAQTVMFGSPAFFGVAADSTAPLYYQWEKNNGVILLATNSQFSILQSRLNDSGAYQVVVTNAYGMATSAVACLSVQFAAPNPRLGPTGAGGASFEVLAEPGRAYWLQSRTNLRDGDWVFVCGITNTTGTQQLVDAVATNQDKFYRIGSAAMP